MSSTLLPTGITNPAFQCTLSICPLKLAQIFYIPSLAGNMLYLILFGLLLISQLALGIKYRTWGFTTGMFGGLILEILGYVGRVKMHYNPFRIDPFLLYIICLTIAPAFLTASIYLCLSRLIVATDSPDPKHRISRLKPRTYSLVFMVADIISLLLQAAGGAIASIAAKSLPKTAAEKRMGNHGVNIMVAGLAFQVASLMVFMGLWCEFELAVHKKVAEISAGGEEKSEIEDTKSSGELKTFEATVFSELATSPRFRHFKIALWLAAVLIFVRSIYRVIELNSGFTGKMANNEPSFMILEGPMIITAVFALTILHPGYAFTGEWNAANWSFRNKA